MLLYILTYLTENLTDINMAYIDIRLRPGIATPAIWPIMAKHDVIHKPEVHNVSQRRQRRTEPWPQGICQKFCEDRSSGSTDMLADRQTDRHTLTQTYTQTDIQTYRQTNWSQYSSAPLQGHSNNTFSITATTITTSSNTTTNEVQLHPTKAFQGITKTDGNCWSWTFNKTIIRKLEYNETLNWGSATPVSSSSSL